MARSLTHVVSFRVTAEEHVRLAKLRATFPEMQWGEVFRWLLEQDQVERVIVERITEDAEPQPRLAPIEMSLPVGDR